MALLTDQILATGVSENDLIHIVITGDTSQNPAGSSYKATMKQVSDFIGVSSFTGNTSGNCINNIFVSNLNACEGNGQLQLKYNNNPNEVMLSNDSGNYSEEFLYLSPGYIEMSSYSTDGYIGSYTNESGNDTSDRFVGHYNFIGGTDLRSGFISAKGKFGLLDDYFAAGIVKSGNTDAWNIVTFENSIVKKNTVNNNTYPTIISSKGSGVDVGIVNSVVLGGENLTADQNNTVYTQNVSVSENLSADTITITSIPITNQDNTNILVRDDISGNVEQRYIPTTISYGLYSQTNDSSVITNTTIENSLIGSGIGSLSVPEDSFNIGDSFRLVIGGLISNGNNETLRIQLKSGSVILANSGLKQIKTSNINDVYKIEVDFTIRNIGVSGVASILTLGTFATLSKNGGDFVGFSFETTNDTTFDTTILNTLDVTAQWGNSSVNNSINSRLFTLTKVF